VPYILPERRAELEAFATPQAETAGELNYLITRLCIAYERYHDSPAYAVKNEVVGALECAKLEFYRRSLVPYEDIKIQENGDCYPK